MDKIAFRRLWGWFADEIEDALGDWQELLLTGLAAGVGALVLHVIALMLKARSTPSELLLTFFLYALGEGFLMCVLISSAKARLHERGPGISDLIPSPPVLAHATLAFVFSKVICGIPMVVFGLPSIANAQAALQAGEGWQAALVNLGLGVFLGGGAFLFLNPLFLFAGILAVDRRMDYVQAMRYSVDCVRRDYVGLLIFQLIWGFLWFAGTALATCLTCGAPLVAVLTAPVLVGVLMRAYQDYFGLGPDWVLDEEAERQGLLAAKEKEESFKNQALSEPSLEPGEKPETSEGATPKPASGAESKTHDGAAPPKPVEKKGVIKP